MVKTKNLNRDEMGSHLDILSPYKALVKYRQLRSCGGKHSIL